MQTCGDLGEIVQLEPSPCYVGLEIMLKEGRVFEEKNLHILEEVEELFQENVKFWKELEVPYNSKTY